MAVTVIKPGLLATVQDIGRFQSQKYGVIASGAMDSYSLRTANLLAGNEENAGAIEITLFGTAVQFTENTVFAITGADMQAVLDGRPAPLNRPLYAEKGAVLSFSFAISGCRAYLAVAGGIAVEAVLGSRSTYLAAEIGGFEGRALQTGDTLPAGAWSEMNEAIFQRVQQDNRTTWAVPSHLLVNTDAEQTIRVLKGTEFDDFEEADRQAFFNESYRLTPQSNRMGARLEGSAVHLREQKEQLSSGVTFGTVQIPPNGKPIILMADRQTTGGYPKIAQVITADLGSLSQMQPGAFIRFKEVTLAEAEQQLLANEQTIGQLKTAIRLKC